MDDFNKSGKIIYYSPTSSSSDRVCKKFRTLPKDHEYIPSLAKHLHVFHSSQCTTLGFCLSTSSQMHRKSYKILYNDNTDIFSFFITNQYKDIIVIMDSISSRVQLFQKQIEDLLALYKSQQSIHDHCIWLRIPEHRLDYLQAAYNYGFRLEHVSHQKYYSLIYAHADKLAELLNEGSHVICISALIFDRSFERMCLIKEKNCPNLPYKFVSGCLKRTESVAQACLREIEEEVGLKVILLSVCSIQEIWRNFRSNRNRLHCFCVCTTNPEFVSYTTTICNNYLFSHPIIINGNKKEVEMDDDDQNNIYSKEMMVQEQEQQQQGEQSFSRDMSLHVIHQLEKISEEITYDQKEICQAGWFSIKEIIEQDVELFVVNHIALYRFLLCIIKEWISSSSSCELTIGDYEQVWFADDNFHEDSYNTLVRPFICSNPLPYNRYTNMLRKTIKECDPISNLILSLRQDITNTQK